MSRIVLVVTGGRDFADAVKEWEQLDRIDREHDVVLVVHGQCMESTENGRPPKLRGADRWADEWATSREKPCLRMPAQWSKRGNAAGPHRNGRMLLAARAFAEVLKAGVIVAAFPGGRGTLDCVCQADALGLPVRKLLDHP